MTQADSARALRRSLDSEPSGAGQVTPQSRRWAHCVLGEHGTDDAALIGYEEAGSGPGWSHYACHTHALSFARTSYAPQWLRDSLGLT